MRKRILSLLLTAAMVFTMLFTLPPITVYADEPIPGDTTDFAGGNGTQDYPYLIETAEQLNNVRNFLGGAYKDTYFQLTAPIDLSSYSNWEPIGDAYHPFCGHFYGAVYDNDTESDVFYPISNLTINRPNEQQVGLFGFFASAEIWGVAIRNANVSGGSDSGTGALVGQSVSYIDSEYRQTWIELCSVTGSVTAVGGYAVGGLVGMATDTLIAQSYSTADVTVTLSYVAGGLVGFLYRSIIDNSYATGSVTFTGIEEYAGGLVGRSTESDIYYCYAAGKVSGDGEIGALIGLRNDSIITQSYFNIANAGSSDDNSRGQGLMTGSMIYQSDYFEYWDFDLSGGIWKVDPWESYPYLQKNEQIPHPTPPLVTSARIVEETDEPRYNASTKTLTMTYAGNGANFMAEDVTPGDGLFIWSSSDTDVTDISLHDDGVITIYGVGAGTATISLKSSNGNTLDSITVIVEPMLLPVTGGFEVEDKEYDGSTAASITATSTLSLDTAGCIGTDAGNLTANFAATFSDPDAGENKAVNLSASTLTGSAAGNYDLDLSSAPTTTGAITQKELTIGGSFTAQNKAHDGTTNAAIASSNLTLIGRVGDDDVTLVPVLAFDTPDIAAGKTVSLTEGSSLTGAKAGNYTLSLIGAPTCTSGLITENEATLGGSITGTVKDISGGPILGAEVSLTVSGSVYSAITDTNGIYSIANVPAGTGYTVTAGKSGYTSASVTGVEVTADTTTSEVDITLNYDPEASLITYKGAQVMQNGAVYDIRFVAVIDTLNAKEVGFVFSKTETVPTRENASEKATTTVYTQITASGSPVTAESLGGRYIIACTVTGIPAGDINVELHVRAFSTVGTETKYTPVTTVTVADLLDD